MQDGVRGRVTSLDHFLQYHVNRLVDHVNLGPTPTLPVNVSELAKLRGVTSVEKRKMIPEAVLGLEPPGFRIYLQSNFENFPGAIIRQRFSLAHEIAHTFFYELSDGKWRPMRDAPRGDSLEAACQKGAGLLLVPRRFLAQEIRNIGEPIGAKHTLELARRFEVSTEVMIRRLDEDGAFATTDIAVVLVRRPPGSSAVIEYATYPPWLKSLLPIPRRGASFSSWVQADELNNFGGDVSALFEDGLERSAVSSSLRASAFRISGSQHIVELRI